MDNATEIMNEIKEYFFANKRGSANEDEIVKLCEDVKKALVLWGDVFSRANTKYESLDDDWVKNHCDETEKAVKQAMYQMKQMGFSITPKLYGLEDHLVYQMRTIPGGIAQLIEHWVEQYHQEATEMERLWCSVSHSVEA